MNASIEKAFRQLFLYGSEISQLELEWMLQGGCDDGLQQQETNVKLLLDIAYRVNCKRAPQLAESVDAIKRNALDFIHLSRQKRSLASRCRYHDAIVSEGRKLCAAVYPRGLRAFNICFEPECREVLQ